VFGAIHPLTLSSSNVSTALTLSPLYLFTFLGLPCSILLVHGAYYAEGAVAVDKGTSHHSTFERKGTNNIISRATRRLGGGALEKEGRSGGVGGIESATVTVVVDVYVDEGVEEEEGEEKEKSSSLDKIRL
jgi:large exoprotein involved in heme utilization and adhesion